MNDASQSQNKKLIYMVLGVIVALVIIAGSIFYFRSRVSLILLKPIDYAVSSVGGKPAEPKKDIQNPLTGIMYTETESKEWANTRPLAVMINNHTDARPQTGLIDADVVYELVAEGGITRYLAFFLTNTPQKIGPVRSTREYYLVLVKELGDAMLMHIGYSPQALVDIETWSIRSLSRGGASFWRENPNNVAIEHTAYVNGVDLRKKGSELGWDGKKDFVSWKFKNDINKYQSMPAATSLSVDFWYKGDYSANWKYDPQTNSYLRYVGYNEKDEPIAHIDNTSKKQITAKNVIVQLATEVSIAGDEKHRLDYQLVGSGKGLVFLDGKVIEITWSKASRDERTMFYDLNGNEIEFNRGNFWIDIVPDRNADLVVYK